MKGYKKYAVGLMVCFVAFGLMSSSASAFWGFGKSKKENNANYAGAVVNVNNKNSKIATSTIVVVSPNGGEQWKAGTKKNIVFKGDVNVIDKPVLLYLRWPNNSFLIGETVLTKSKKIYSWKIPKALEQRNDYKITVVAHDGTITIAEDESDNFFSIISKK